MRLDHLVVGATTLEEARTHIEDALGIAMQPGGQHAVFHTHNSLLGLEDGIYLEAIAPDPTLPPPHRPRWYDLDRFRGPARLSNWAAAVPDLDAALGQMPDGTGERVAVQRGDLRWRMAVSSAGTTPYDCLWPALIEWPDAVHPASRLASTGLRLKRFTLRHPNGDTLARALELHMRDDRLRIETGQLAMQAEFDGPDGPRTL